MATETRVGTKDARPQSEILLIALLLKVGGHSLTDAEIERAAATHVLVVGKDADGLTVLGAESKPVTV